MSAWIAPQSPPDDAARIRELRAELSDLRNHFDDLAGFPADTQANILTRLRELADLTGEPMLTHDQTEALVRELDTARTEADALRASLTEARALLTECAAEVEARGADPSLAAAIRAWLGVCDG